MKIRKTIFTVILSAVAFISIADNFNLPSATLNKIQDEAEDYMDNVPDGLQDKLADAVTHSLEGVSSELNYFRKYQIRDKEDFKNIKISEEKIGNLNVRFYSDSMENGKKPLLVFFHAGGLSMGSLDTSDEFCKALVNPGGLNVISIDYPLMPENNLDKIIGEIITTISLISQDFFEKDIDLDHITMGGDGAGAFIALSTWIKLKKESSSVNVKSLALYYPILNINNPLNKENKRNYGRGYGFDFRLWEAFINVIKSDKTDNIDLLKDIPSNPFLRELPPTLLISSGRDIVIEDSEKLQSLSTSINFIKLDEALHGFVYDRGQPTAFNLAVDLTRAFIIENN